MSQIQHVRKVKEIPENLSNEEGFKFFRSQRARAAYPATMTRPDLLCYTSLYSQVTQEKFTPRSRKSFNRFVRHVQGVLNVPLKFVRLDPDTLSVVTFTDASFSSTGELRSQLGVLVVLRDSKGNANLVHASSLRGRRRARSVLSAEMFALLDGFDAGFVVRELVSNLLGRKVELHMLTDSRSAFHITTTLISTKEKRLMLDVHLLREAYESREISRILWITGDSNLADCLTKIKNNGTLFKYLTTNEVHICCNAWVDRDLRPVHLVDVPMNNREEMMKEVSRRLQEVDERIYKAIPNDSNNQVVRKESRPSV